MMNVNNLTQEERKQLLSLARQVLDDSLHGRPISPLDNEKLSLKFRENGATFVTLTKQGELRGCVGTLEAYQPLAEDVIEHALAAAFKDYRFNPLELSELSEVKIEISRLTPPTKLEYDRPEDLLTLLKPNVDGVILRDGMRRATFLPQVWEKIPDPATFLNHLCQKMGAEPSLWRYRKIQVYTYQVEMFEE